MYYVLTGIVCYQEMISYHNHFAAITIKRINHGANNITYQLYNDDISPEIDTVAGSHVFPVGTFTNPAYQLAYGELYPCILIYERYSDYITGGPTKLL